MKATQTEVVLIRQVALCAQAIVPVAQLQSEFLQLLTCMVGHHKQACGNTHLLKLCSEL